MLFARLRKLLYYTVSFLFVVISVPFLFLYYFGMDLPSEETLKNYNPPRTTRLFSRDGELIEEYAIEHRIMVKFNEIPMMVKGAFITAEDKEFYNHSGINILSLARALIDNTLRRNGNKHLVGGSTITQQIAKNLLVGNSKTITRKIREAIMAFRIEKTISKDKILEIYLNHIYLGKGSYGIADACNSYFGKPMERLEPHEAAFLASIPSAPMIYINNKNSVKLLRKRNNILRSMYEAGYITKEQLIVSYNKPIVIKHKKQKIFAPYFANEIFRQMTKNMSRDEFFRGGYSIQTTLDKKMQYCAQKALEDGIIDYTRKTKWEGTLGNIYNDKNIDLSVIDENLPTTLNEICSCVVVDVLKDALVCKTSSGETIKVKIVGKTYKLAKFFKGDVVLCRKLEDKIFELYQTPKVTGGVVVIDAKTGDVTALVGGYSPDLCAFNCITQSKRQPGSTLKPFIFALALENGFDEKSLVDDAPVAIKLANGQVWHPRNYDNKFMGKIPLKDALILSRNCAFVRVSLALGLERISNLFVKLGLYTSKITWSGVLGASEVSPLALVTAYSSLVNSGSLVHPKFIKSAHINHVSVVSDSVTSPVISALVECSYSYFNKLELTPLHYMCGKSGTSNNFCDAWFAGSFLANSTRYSIVVWIGFPHPKSLGRNRFGSNIAFPIANNLFINYRKCHLNLKSFSDSYPD